MDSHKTVSTDHNLLREGTREVAILCDMHSLMPVGFFMLSMNDFLPGCLFS